MQNTLKVANALSIEGKPETKIATVRELFATGKIPTEFKKGQGVVVNGIELKDEKGVAVTGAAIRAAADELGFSLKTVSEWVAVA